MSVSIVGIQYELQGEGESSQPKYGTVRLRMARDREELFATGDPTVDYLTACFVVNFRTGAESVMNSSSVDHFVMDGGTLLVDEPTEAHLALAAENAAAYLIRCGEQRVVPDRLLAKVLGRTEAGAGAGAGAEAGVEAEVLMIASRWHPVHLPLERKSDEV